MKKGKYGLIFSHFGALLSFRGIACAYFLCVSGINTLKMFKYALILKLSCIQYLRKVCPTDTWCQL